MLEHASAEARRYFELAYRAQMDQRIDEAISLYEKSIEAQPTAEAHTFLGWAMSAQSRARKRSERTSPRVNDA